MMVGPEQDPGGESQPLLAPVFFSRSTATQQVEVKVENQEDLGEIWETQWQEFLTTVDVPQILPEPSPWEDAHIFLASFEQVARAFQWPKEEWAARLRPTLGGDAEQAYRSLEAGDREDYGKMKAAILHAEAASREKQRQHFRRFCYQEAQGPRQVYNQLQSLCRQWLKVDRHSKEQILEMLILEQFMAILPLEMQNWVKRHHVESSAQVISLAEDFLLRPLGIMEQEGGEELGPRSENMPPLERGPSDAGQKLQFARELKVEEDADADIWKLRESENDLQGRAKQNEQHGAPPERANTVAVPGCDPEESLGGQQGVSSMEGSPFIISYEQAGRKAEIIVFCSDTQKEKRRKQCLVCGKSFSRTSALHRHERIHTGEKSHRCFQCDKSFYDRTALKRHQGTHNTGRGYPRVSQAQPGESLSLPPSDQIAQNFFSEGGKQLDTVLDLNVHQRIHQEQNPSGSKTGSGETSGISQTLEQRKQPAALPVRRYKCPACEKSFIWNSSYHRHKRIHLMNKSMPLAFDRNSFKQGSHIVKLQPSPIGGKKHYECPECKKSFPALKSLEKHKKLHQGAKLKSSPQKAPETKDKNCPECGKFFDRLSHLKRHQRVHTGEKPYKCPKCEESFMWQASFERHLNVHKKGKPTPPVPTVSVSQEKPNQCLECGKTFTQQSDLMRHLRVHTGEKPHRCTECGESFMWPSSLHRHRKKVHRGKRLVPLLQKLPLGQGRSYKCFECGKSFDRSSSLINHRRTHTRKKTYSCTGCEKTFMWPHSLLRHQKIHETSKAGVPLPQKPIPGEKSYICSDCGKRFVYSYLLIRHRRIHTGEKPYKCTKCGESFRWASSFSLHQKKVHADTKAAHLPRQSDGQKKPYRCSECGKGYRIPSHLSSHQSTHTGERKHKCTTCEKSFFWQSSLSLHQKDVHKTEEKKPVPALQPVSQGQGDSKPQQVPAEGKAFQCSKCEESFVGVSALLRHRKIHEREKQGLFFQTSPVTSGKLYPCTECGKNFNCPSRLLRHQRVHSQEKPCQCPDCGESFRWDSGLKAHQKKMHKRKQAVSFLPKDDAAEEKNHPCAECGKTFPSVSSLTKHQSIHTGEKLDKSSHCEENFPWNSALQEPLKACKEEEPNSLLQKLPSKRGIAYPCLQCGKKFSKLKLLQKHRRFHQEKRYVCNECGKRFTQSASLKRHWFSHQEKSFHCSHCEKSFVYKDSLTRHEKSHTGLAEFTMQVLDKEFLATPESSPCIASEPGVCGSPLELQAENPVPPSNALEVVVT